jgi:hypothetical protein
MFGLRNGNAPLILVKDNYSAYQIKRYIEERNGKVSRCRNYENGSFCVDALKAVTDIGKFSSIGLIDLEIDEELLSIIQVPILKTMLESREKISVDTYWSPRNAPEAYSYTVANKMLDDEDIRDLFINTFKIAKKEIDIICPWINQTVVNDRLLALIKEALERGVKIKIVYGMGDDQRSRTSEQTVEMMKRIFCEYAERILFYKGNTHVKMLLCDDKYSLVGSYNFLSFAGNYEAENVRAEAAECNVDARLIAQKRTRYFSW